MGVTSVELRGLSDAIRYGARFDSTITLGRHWLLEKGAELDRLVASLPATEDRKRTYLSHPGDWADDLFRLLGASSVASLDISGYEGATLIHDLNTPIPKDLCGKFDFVFDGGTTEHVFNVFQALKNMMELTRVGGHVFSSVPANNLMGHGFYQFSPELYYRVFCPDNGFEVVRLTLTESKSGRRYEVVDSAKAGRRIEIFATAPATMLGCLARRTADVPILTRSPAQSDYVAAWAVGGHAPLPSGRGSKLRAALARAGERWCPRLLGYVRYRRTMDLKWHPDLFRPLAD